MVKRYNPKAGAEHEGSAAKPHAEMGGNNHSSIRPQDAINEFLLEMIPVKTELTERFEQQKEEEDQVRQVRLRERTQSRTKSNASRKLVAEKAHHNTTLVKKNLVQSQDSQDRDHTKTMFTPDELAQQKEEEEAERWLAELETKPIKPDPGEQLDGATPSANKLETVETKVDPESISSNPVIAMPVNENRSLYTVPDNSPSEALDERASLAVQRAAARHKDSRLDGSTQFREPVSLAEKLLRARLASTLEETDNANPVKQAKVSLVETEAKSKLVSAEPAVVAETIVSESMVAERQTPSERDVVSEVPSPDIKCDATSQKLTKVETLVKPVEQPVASVETEALVVAPPAPPGNGEKPGRP
ncbi:MAG: hypothetical protein MI864_19885, partial [Pseudomonadales bacterium]|nr:hypothetical protein [Pseudomonadales bacterium]